MQSLDVNHPGMDDLQFVLVVSALCTSGLQTLNIPESVRTSLFDRCWVLVHEGPLPTHPNERVLDLRGGTDLTLQALVATIRETLAAAGVTRLTWDHAPSEPRLPSSPQAQPLVERLQQLYPTQSDSDSGPQSGRAGG